MIDIYLHIMAFLRTFVYMLISLFSLLVFSSYHRAYCKDKPTWIIQSVVILFLSIAFSFLFYSIASIINLVEGVGLRYKIVVSLLTITNLPLLFSIINFWNASINQPTDTGKDRKSFQRSDDCV